MRCSSVPQRRHLLEHGPVVHLRLQRRIRRSTLPNGAETNGGVDDDKSGKLPMVGPPLSGQLVVGRWMQQVPVPRRPGRLHSRVVRASQLSRRPHQSRWQILRTLGNLSFGPVWMLATALSGLRTVPTAQARQALTRSRRHRFLLAQSDGQPIGSHLRSPDSGSRPVQGPAGILCPVVVRSFAQIGGRSEPSLGQFPRASAATHGEAVVGHPLRSQGPPGRCRSSHYRKSRALLWILILNLFQASKWHKC